MSEAKLISNIEKESDQFTHFTISQEWLAKDDLRIDVSYYAQTHILARKLLADFGYKILSTEYFSERIFNPPPIKRYFAEDHNGTPYLAPSDLFSFRLQPTKYVHEKMIKNVSDWYVKKDWILITQSGQVGIPLLSSKRLENFVVSQNLIRIIPKKNTLIGYLYAFFSTWLGNALLIKNQYGQTVEHIDPEHVSQIPIPDIPKEIQIRIHNNIIKAHNLREKARELLDYSEQQLLKELGLPNFSEGKEKKFIVKANEFNLRLDASYHYLKASGIIDKLKKSGLEILTLDDPTLVKIFIPPRFKRIYVKREHGIPFLQGGDILKIKPLLLKYISKRTKNLTKWVIHEGWVLVTCSGTSGRGLGKTALVPKIWDGWTLSQHALRIIPENNRLHPGYLATFLMCRWGYEQIIAKTYGGFIDEISEKDVKEIQIPIPSSFDIQEKIGKFTMEAFELKEKASFIENATISTLEDMITDESRKLELYEETLELIGEEEMGEVYRESKQNMLNRYENLRNELGTM